MGRIGQVGKLLLILALPLLLSSAGHCGQKMNAHTRKLDYCVTMQEEDGSPANKACKPIKVTNGTLTDNGSYYSLGTGGGGSGDSVTVNSNDVDTTANFLDGLIEWTLTDGGAGGPDDITGALLDTSVVAGDYTVATISVDADGRVTYAATGSLTGLADVGSSTQTAGYFLISDGADFQSIEITGDCTITPQGVITCPGGGATAWDDIGDPDNDGLTTIDFDHASENTVFTNIYDAAGSFLKLDNTDADLSNETSLLGLEFTADADDQATFILATDNNGDQMWKLGVNGKMTIGPGAADYILPTTRGAAGSVLQDNGAGAVTFEVLESTDLDDIGSSTQTGGNLYISDGVDFQSIVMSGDIAITAQGVTTIQANSVALGTDTYGSYAAGDGEAGNATGLACTGCVGTTDLEDTGVGAAAYMTPTITIDADGRIAHAASGSLTGLADVGSSTQGAGRLIISDGSDFQSIEMSGDCTVGAAGVMVCTGGAGDVTKVDTPVDNEIGVWTGDGTIEGDTNLQWNGSKISLNGNLELLGTGDIYSVNAFDIYTSGSSDDILIDPNSGGAATLSLGVSGDSDVINVYGETTLLGAFNQSGGDVEFNTTNLVIRETTAFVGIATSAPTTALEVKGVLKVSGSGNPGIAFAGETADPCGVEPEGFCFYNETDHYICFCDDSGDDLQVGVGSTSPCF